MWQSKGRDEVYTYYRDAEITPTTGDNLKSITDRKGRVTTFSEYDAMGRLKKVMFDDSSTIDYLYDAGGRIDTITDSLSGAISYEYEDLGCSTCGGQALDRVKSETTSAGIVEYDYDPLGRRTAMRAPGSPQVDYGYDGLGQLTSVTRLLAGESKTFHIEYDEKGRRTSLYSELYQDAQGSHKLLTTYDYDAASRLVKLLSQSPAGLIENADYRYSSDGNRSGVDQTANIPLAAPLSTTSYSDSNEMESFNDATLSYDLNGNLETRIDGCGQTDFTWDARNRLIGISGYQRDFPTCTPLTASIDYDALNRRVEKTVDGTTSQYVYDGWDIVQMTAGAVLTDYVRTLNIDEPLALEQDGTLVRYFKADVLGSVIALVDANGNVTTSYAYDAFGSVIISGETIGNPFQYTGRENDGTGLYYYRARYYSPEMRRFISEDPIGLAGGMNSYIYVQNKPVYWTDPLGLAPGHPYPNQHEAARAALSEINPQSIREGKEYAGLIFKNRGGSYSYTAPVPGGRSGHRVPDRDTCPNGTLPTAFYHTHGKYHQPSDEDWSHWDSSAANMTGLDGYLGTPGGQFFYYNHITDKLKNLWFTEGFIETK